MSPTPGSAGDRTRTFPESDLAKSIGSDDIDTLSQHTGLSRDELLSGLSRELPGAIDELTPDGRVPTADEASRWVWRATSLRNGKTLAFFRRVFSCPAIGGTLLDGNSSTLAGESLHRDRLRAACAPYLSTLPPASTQSLKPPRL